MGQITSSIINVIDKLNKLIEYILAIFLAVMSAVIFWQVFSRYVIGSSTAWSEELARVLMVYVVLLGAAVALRRGQLLSVEILTDIVGSTARRGIIIFVNALSLIFYIVLLVYGYSLAENVSGQKLPGLGISMFWMYFALPVGGFFLTLNAIVNIIENSKGGRK